VGLLRVDRRRATRRLIFVVRHIEALKSELIACSRACRRRHRYVCEWRSASGGHSRRRAINLRDPAMNGVRTRQWTDTAKGEGIAQGVIQREKSIHGKKEKSAFGAVPMQPRQQNAVASSASKPHSLNLRLGPPIRPASLDTV
jgi:hypothetical protein